MNILSIDTSCDDTSIAVLKGDKQKIKILSNIVSSQIKFHRKYGGVFPSLAKRKHQENLIPVLKKALKKAELLKKNKTIRSPISNSKLKTLEKILEREPNLLKNLIKFFELYEKPKINAIAVTNGPGLEMCLYTGVNFAKALSYFWNLPIIPINHIEGHIFANWLSRNSENHKQIKFPAICLVVSGGHTQIILMKKIGKYKILGETRDDAAGECLDKTARILGLEYPGGPAIADKATKFSSHNSQFSIKLPRPMIYSKDYDFSFSGLKTAALYNYKKRSLKIRKSKKYIQEMCVEIQQSVIDVLIKKTLKATQDYKAKTIIIGGGVVANKELKKQFISKIAKENLLELKPEFLAPEKKLCVDNAVMIGAVAYFNDYKPKHWKNIIVNSNLKI